MRHGGCAEEDLSRPSSGATDLNLARSIPCFLPLPRCADGPQHAQPGHRIARQPGLALTRPPGSRAEEGGALRWRTLNVLCGVEFCVKQNFAPRYSDAASDVDARLHGSRGEGRPAENPPTRLGRKTGSPEDRGGRKTASPKGHSERGGRIAQCRKSASSAWKKSWNPDTRSGPRTQSSGAKMLTSIRSRAPKMSTSILAEQN